MSKKTAVEHLKHEHKQSPFKTYFQEIIYGGNDGIITTFAVVAGFAGAEIASVIPGYSIIIVFLFGMANLAADGLSMGLGNFLSVRSEQDLYKKESEKERERLKNDRQAEIEETLEILREKGFSQKDALDLTKIYSKNEDYWVSFMMNFEHEIPNPTKENPFLTALATFLAFVVFGFIPLVPFIVYPSQALSYSAIATFSALLILGLLRWKITGDKLLKSVFEIIFVGGIAAVSAYLVGSLFKF